MRVTLRQLQVFAAIARHCSVSKGASDVCLSQSAASMSLQQLEDALQVSLFHRNGKQIVLNENGRRIQPIASSLLAMAADLEQVAGVGAAAGTLRIAASTTVGDFLLGPVFRDFKGQFPGAQLILKVMHSGEVMSEVESMASDIGFIESPCNRANFTVEPLYSEKLVVFAAPDHPLAHMRQLRLEDVQSAAWCLMDATSYTRTTLTTAIRKRVEIALTTNTVASIKSAVIAGCGLGCLSRHAIADDLASGNLVELQVIDLHLDRVISMISPRNLYKGWLKEGFEAIARNHFAAIRDREM